METRGKSSRKRSGKPARKPKVRPEDQSLADELLSVSRKEQAVFRAGWRKFLEDLGIHGKPIDAKKLHAMAIREGIDPNDNQFSRGIVAMREE